MATYFIVVHEEYFENSGSVAPNSYKMTYSQAVQRAKQLSDLNGECYIVAEVVGEVSPPKKPKSTLKVLR